MTDRKFAVSIQRQHALQIHGYINGSASCRCGEWQLTIAGAASHPMIKREHDRHIDAVLVAAKGIENA